MEESKKDKKQRIAVFYDSAYKEVSRIQYTKVQIWWLIVFVFLVLFVLDFFIISYTPAKYLIPDYPTKTVINTMRMNDILMDSIRQELAVKNQYIDNLIRILRNDSLDNYTRELSKDSAAQMTGSDSNSNFPQMKNVISHEDSLLRQEVEEQEMFSKQMGTTEITAQTNLYQLNFFPPVKGIVSNPYNPANNHFGVDIVASPNQMVLAVLDGTVINASWAVQTGYTVQIQHHFNIITAYKHLKNVIVKEGDKIKAGQPIAMVGNTGTLSMGPHLHFELWHNGISLNPEEYISFK